VCTTSINDTALAEQAEPRRKHGWFYYRFNAGESPADCFDRTSSFLETLSRQLERKEAERALVVSHGLTIRCFVMRFLHLTIEDFEVMLNPHNCDIVTLSLADEADPADGEVVFHAGRWVVQGLVLAPHSHQRYRRHH